MNYKQFTRSTKTDKLQVINSDKPILFHIIPEVGSFAVNTLFINGLILTNCAAFISKSQQIKLGIKTFNTRKIYIDAKTKLSTKDVVDSNKTIPVFQDYPDNLYDMLEKEKKYAVIDHTILSQATNYIVQQSNVRNGAFFLLQQLKKEFNFIKTKYPQIENNILFVLNDTKVEGGISDAIQHFVNLPSNVNELLNCYDRYMLVSMSSMITNPTVFPIAGYKLNSPTPELYKANLPIVDKIYKSREKELASQQPVEQPIENPETTKEEINQLEVKLSELNINKPQLKRVLKKYQVRDKSIADNIKQSIIDYTTTNPKVLSQDNLEKVVLLSINKSLFNSDVIDDHYINNPIKLFSKLEEVNTYSQELNYPKTVDNYILDPNKTIGLKRVTSLVRHKYEFSDNIHKNIETLFAELQTRPNDSIKIVKIDHKYEDNNVNRFINYQVTLKNLTGKNKKPYKVNIKIPALVNDRYFKLNGQNYILSNQQFFVPITKTEPDECRLMNSYQTLTLSLANLKINISEISKFIQYIESRYPEKIVSIETDINKNVIRATLKNEHDKNCTIDLTSKTAYECGNIKLILNDDNNKWVEENNGQINKLNIGKSEYLYDALVRILTHANPIETVKKSPKTIPYIVIHVMALKIPLIVYMWQQLGLIKSLQKLGIDYRVDIDPDPSDHFSIQLENNKYMMIFPKTRRDELIINGLHDIDFKKYKFASEKSLNDRHSIDEFLLDKDTRSLINLDLIAANVLDTITKDLLEHEGKSTNIIDLLSNDMVNKLLNDPPDVLSDLKIYRNRQAEIIFTLLYRVLMMAHKTYATELKFNDDAKLFLSENYVTECLLGINPHMKGSAAIELVNPYSPITELKSASKIIKTGPRGLPSKRMIKSSHRNIHPSYYGNIGANACTEYADVGIVNHLTMTTLLSNKYGSFGTKDVHGIDGWELLTLDESLVPFINEMQSDRAFLALNIAPLCSNTY